MYRNNLKSPQVMKTYKLQRFSLFSLFCYIENIVNCIDLFFMGYTPWLQLSHAGQEFADRN